MLYSKIYLLNQIVIIGPDRAKFCVHNSSTSDKPIDEIEEYWSGRYLATTEGAWRILGYNITQKTPAVTMLPVHLPNSPHHKQYHCENPLATQSNLEHYFARPQGIILDGTDQHDFKDLTYTKYFSRFCLEKFSEANVGKSGFFSEHYTADQDVPMMHVIQCDPLQPHLSCLQSTHISHGELFYLRSLLLSQPGTS